MEIAVEKEQESIEIPDPEVELERVLEEKEQWDQAQRELTSEVERISAAEKDLHHRLATNLVTSLFQNLEAFAELFTESSVFQKYEDIQKIAQKIKKHDAVFPASLSQGKYSVDMSQTEYGFWASHLQNSIAVGEPLERFLKAVYGKSTHQTPFER